jgi:endoglucanase
MPTDTAKNKLMISVHYYNPSTFTILEADADWGKSAFSWGTSSEINVVKTDLQKMKKFSDTGVPVIVGEYGSTTVNKDAASVRLYLQTVCQVAYDLGYCPMLWDPGTHFSRTDLRFKDSQLAPIFAKYKNLSRITLPTVTPEKTAAPINSVVGDANGDKTFNSIDFATVRLHLLGVSKLTGENLRAADVNGDGQVNSIDFALMRQYILGIITSFSTIT